MINDILDFSRIEAGKLDLESIDFSIDKLLEQLRSLLAPQAAELGLELHVTCDADVPKLVQGDPTRIKQVLVNLAGNGLKFTPRGSVTIAVLRCAGAAGSAPRSKPVRKRLILRPRRYAWRNCRTSSRALAKPLPPF